MGFHPLESRPPGQFLVVNLSASRGALHQGVNVPRRLTPIRPEARARLIAAIARARGWVSDLTRGTVASTGEIAARDGISERSVRMTLPLAFLAPAIVNAAINRTLPSSAGLTTLSELPPSWSLQEASLAGIAWHHAPVRKSETHQVI